MPKIKNYKVSDIKNGNSEFRDAAQMPVAIANPEKSSRSAADADIDLRKLLGPDARFPTSVRTIILSPNLGNWIDDWVFASADAIRSLLRSGKSPETCRGYRAGILHFYDWLSIGRDDAGLAKSKPCAPSELQPQHINEFLAWLKKKGQNKNWKKESARTLYVQAKAVIENMFELGLIKGETHQFFKRGAFEKGSGVSKHTSFSDHEQERLSMAIKSDMSAIHHGRLKVSMRELQALRLLVVAHRMGHNTTPLLELTRDAIRPGLLPGTILLKTKKYRNRKIISQVGRAGPDAAPTEGPSSIAQAENPDASLDQSEDSAQDYLPFSFAEGAVIQLAIASTKHLLEKSPDRLKNLVWLYEISNNGPHGRRKGDITSLTPGSLIVSIKSIVKRHKLVGDDGNRLVVNNSRFRKSRFDRVFRLADGDLAITANLMGNTPAVAAVNYPSMNLSRQAEAAGFMNEDYVDLMLDTATTGSVHGSELQDGPPESTLRTIDIKPTSQVQTQTPVSGCNDSLGGEFAPKNGSACDRFVMCLFCSSFAIVGTVDELWRLFSFQVFARAELDYLEQLGPLHSVDEGLDDLRNRYRLAIPYIDSFTERQFTANRVSLARVKTVAGLHPFWEIQLSASRRARNPAPYSGGVDEVDDGFEPKNGS